MDDVQPQQGSPVIPIARILMVAFFLYLFLLSVKLLGGGFHMLGEGFAKQLIRTTNNPFVGLIIGILATSVVQSSSVTTSMVVSLVGCGTLTLEHAVPIIMGANIGTTVTNLIVSLAHVTRKQEFERALSAASVHDMFNLMTVILLLPLELATGYLRRAAWFLAHHLVHEGEPGKAMISPLKVILDPAAKLVQDLAGHLPGRGAAVAVIVFSVVLLFAALFFLVRIMKSAALSRVEVIFDRYLDRRGLTGLALGCVVTAIIQSSSVTTSLMVPMAAAGIVRIEQIFPITLGANLGTTVTALIASLTGDVRGLAIALVHVLFNVTGILIFFPFKPIRNIPIGAARWFASVAAKRRVIAFAYVLGVFYVLPFSLVVLSRLLGPSK